jgi:ABC-type antimicrobial peptide transport system permease subunit
MREIGIRKSLGADARQIVALVAGRTMTIVAVGVTLGVAAGDDRRAPRRLAAVG